MSELQMKQIKTPEQIKEMCFLASRIWREHYGQILSADQITYMVEKFQSFKAVTNQIEHQGYTYCWLVCDGQNAGFAATKLKTVPYSSASFILRKHSGAKAWPALL